ncbi:uncharacterized protein M6B38_167385 [Iris pallida]|uniref:Secreted protein n=1 Tax=Iris pallida TaxID=29817 RepID=A0AAX6EWM4_IRIPA|nr:uncharacterized protein M6B38_167385 [Iris pallida]
MRRRRTELGFLLAVAFFVPSIPRRRRWRDSSTPAAEGGRGLCSASERPRGTPPSSALPPVPALRLQREGPTYLPSYPSLSLSSLSFRSVTAKNKHGHT